MKKSEQYRTAMICVLNSESLETEAKLDIIETLLDDESIAKFRESQEDKE